MKKLYMVKKKNSKFYVCEYECGLYAIDKITKSVGYTVKAFGNLKDLEAYLNAEGFKKVS